VPEHMNVLGADEALSQVRYISWLIPLGTRLLSAHLQLVKTTWTSTELEDHTFLPLGVAPSMLR
jgi:hypothetical protein